MLNTPQDNITFMAGNSQGSPPAIAASENSIYINGEKYPLSERVLKNIESVIGFQTNQVKNIPIHERILNNIAAFFGKPEFLYLQLFLFTAWWVCSHIAPDLLPWNLPKFDLQEMGIDAASLLIATGVLVQQSRQDKLAEQRSHLTLQLELLTEQKIAKLIELIEELRSDLPSVRDRYDWEAQVMQQATDPQIVLDIIRKNLEPMATKTQQLNIEEVENKETDRQKEHE